MKTPQRLGLIRIVVGVATTVMVLVTGSPISVLGRLALMVALVFVFVFALFRFVGVGRAVSALLIALLVGMSGNQQNRGIERLRRLGLA